MKKIKKILKIVVWTVVIIVSFFLIVSSFDIFGYRVFSVQSGSMEPKIKIGSLVLTKNQADYKINSIITFKTNQGKDTITHRITGVQTDSTGVFYETKGDANDAPDNELVSQDNVVGEVKFTAPYFGYLVSSIKTLPGLIIFIIIPATIIVYEEINSIRREIKKITGKKSRKKKDSNKSVAKKDNPKNLDGLKPKHSKKEVKSWTKKLSKVYF